MPIKRIFNQKSQREKAKSNMNEFEKQILRINALEVQIKKLLEFEKQLRTSMYGTGRGEKKENSWTESKMEGRSTENVEDGQKVDSRYKKLNELTRRLNKLEHLVQDIITTKNDSYRNSQHTVEEKVEESRLLNIVERIVTEKLAAHIKKEEKMHGKIRELESQISKLVERENNRPKSGEMTANRPLFDRTGEDRAKQDEADDESFYSHIKMRVLALEHNFLLVNEVQAGLLKRVDQLLEKCNEFIKETGETKESTTQQDSIFKTLYIDKLYLDKYEQNNNFSQLGIKELSGALNIGATYGSNAIPKEVTEEVKEEMEKMKATKEKMNAAKEKVEDANDKMEKHQASEDKPPEPQNDESSSSSDSNYIPPEEEEPYTDIDIEE